MIPPANLSERALGLLVPTCLALCLAACGRSAPMHFATASSLSDSPRRAPGVAVDPTTELPSAANQADTQDGVVVLSAPADPESAREVVKSFFRAVSQGSYPELEPIVSDDVWLQGGAMVGRQKARQYWQLRLSRLDYTSLAGSSVYRESELETYRATDLPKLRPPRVLGVATQPNDLIVRVPISTPRSGKTRLFGDEVLFVLRSKGERYSIVEIAEDFSLP